MKAARDDGFTLVELLISITLMVILVPVIGLVLTTMMKQTTATQDRMEVSHDAQLAAAYFADDVASTGARNSSGDSLQSVEKDVSPTGGLYPCGPASLPKAAVRLAWDELTDGPPEVRTRVVVAYVAETVGTGPEQHKELHRVECRGGSTMTSDDIVVNRLWATPDPTLDCASPSSCTDANPPKRITLGIKITDKHSNETLDVVLTGQRRQS